MGATFINIRSKTHLFEHFRITDFVRQFKAEDDLDSPLYTRNKAAVKTVERSPFLSTKEWNVKGIMLIDYLEHGIQ